MKHIKRKLSAILSAVMLCTLCVAPASALELTIGAPDDYLFGRPTSDDTIYEWENPNVDRSKNTALIPPTFGSPTSYLPGSGEYLTPNLVPGALSGGLVNQAGSVGNPNGGTSVDAMGSYPAASTSVDSSGFPTVSGGTSSFQATAFTEVTSNLYYSNGSLGTLKIPSIGLTVGIYEGTGTDPLRKGAGHFEGTSIRGVNIGYENDVTTGADGKVTLPNMPSGCYEIEETAVPAPWILDTNNRQTVWIDAEQGQDVVADFVNSTRPELRLRKVDQQTKKPIGGAVFLIEEVGGGFSERRETDADGLIVLGSEDGLCPGVFQISEVVAAPNYVLDDTVHTVVLEENRSTTIELTNLEKPTLKILKVDSITKNPVQNAKFQIWRASGETKAGDYYDLGTFYSNEAGEIVLEHTDPGWFKVSELEAPSGYSIYDESV